AKDAVKEATKTVKNIQSVYIKGFQAIVKDNKIDKFRVDAKITFIVD
ncbi:dodecin domain-containing protein, partial [bacterium]|nr:dodecin domain-containing protein [bacterium]MCE5223293.1 dodecin domain-containing protein [bacterium]